MPSTGSVTVVIEPGASRIHARMRAALSGLDEGTFIRACALSPGLYAYLV
jgi:hypothetical protein